MSRVWAFFYARRGRTDLLGTIEYRLFNRDGAYARYYWARTGERTLAILRGEA